MKLPNSFRMENLDDKTQQLAEEANIFQDTSEYPEDLTSLLNHFDSPNYSVHNTLYANHPTIEYKIKGLIKQQGYQEIPSKERGCKYWLNPKTKDSDMNHVLINIGTLTGIGRYRVASVKKKNLQKMIKKHQKDYNKGYKASKRRERIIMGEGEELGRALYFVGMFGVAAASTFLASHFAEFPIFSKMSVPFFLVGFMGGAGIGGAVHHFYEDKLPDSLDAKEKKYYEKSNKYCESFIADEKLAVETAFR